MKTVLTVFISAKVVRSTECYTSYRYNPICSVYLESEMTSSLHSIVILCYFLSLFLSPLSLSSLSFSLKHNLSVSLSRSR